MAVAEVALQTRTAVADRDKTINQIVDSVVRGDIISIRRVWYDCFDPTLSPEARNQASCTVMSVIRSAVARSPPTSKVPIKELQNLPSDTVLVQIMVRGLPECISIARQLGESENPIVPIGYSTGNYSDPTFRDGVGASRKIFVHEADMQLLKALRRHVLLIDHYCKTEETAQAVADYLVKNGLESIDLVTEKKLFFEVRRPGNPGMVKSIIRSFLPESPPSSA